MNIREELRSIQAELKKPFPATAHVIRELPGKGYWAFVPHQTIRARLDEVVPEWQSDFSSIEQVHDTVVCRCGITILGIRKEAIGCVPLVAATNRDGKDVSRGNAGDRVAAEALKNAAEMWLVGAYLDDQAWVAHYLNQNSALLSDKIKADLRSLIAYLRTKGEFPDTNSSVSITPKTSTFESKPKTKQPPSASSNVVNNPVIEKPAETQPLPTSLERDLLMKEIDSLCKRKNITEVTGKAILMDLYKVQSRSKLTDKQLLAFRDYLAVRPQEALR